MTSSELGLSDRFEVAMRGRLGRSGIFVRVADNAYYLDESRLREFMQRPQVSQYHGMASQERKEIADFDGYALFEAMNAKRISEGLSWPQVADEIWKLSSDLNNRRHDHPDQSFNDYWHVRERKHVMSAYSFLSQVVRPFSREFSERR